jgi:NAD(P)-dependent dehydrogenase (short-subunit alcohol dehydrogenase family)
LIRPHRNLSRAWRALSKEQPLSQALVQVNSHIIHCISQHQPRKIGIGRATAIAFARNKIGALALADINIPDLDATCHQISLLFPDLPVQVLHVNVVDENCVDEAIKQTAQRFGGIDIGVNCAGISGNPTPTDRMPLAEWQKVIDVNQTGLWLCQRALIRQMLTQEYVNSRVNMELKVANDLKMARDS